MKTKKQPTPANVTDQRPTCCECGGHNVETNAWIETRPDGTLAVVNSDGPISGNDGNWCHDCDAHVDLDYPDTTPADDARRQAADAAREAGPELLDACRQLLAAFSDVVGGYSADELHATPADIIRQAEAALARASAGDCIYGTDAAN